MQQDRVEEYGDSFVLFPKTGIPGSTVGAANFPGNCFWAHVLPAAAEKRTVQYCTDLEEHCDQEPSDENVPSQVVLYLPCIGKINKDGKVNHGRTKGMRVVSRSHTVQWSQVVVYVSLTAGTSRTSRYPEWDSLRY